MATFDNVTYTFYSDEMGRAVIPTEQEFDALALINIQTVKKLLPYIEELEENGIDKAVCLMCEVDYQDAQTTNGESAGAITSESLGGHSISYGSVERNKLMELNAKSTEAKKIDRLKLYCSLNIGVK